MQEKVIEGFRLSPQQERLWALQQGEQSQPYRARCAILFEGDLNSKALKGALHQVISRHEILHTTFRFLSGMSSPLQVIAESDTPPGCDHDMSGQRAPEQEAEINALFQSTSQKSFDFERGPILHVSQAILSPTRQILFIDLPALCADSITLGNLAREIACCYAASVDGEEASDEPMQYADISEILNELLEGESTNAGREFWRRKDFSQLSGMNLPFEIRPCGEQGFAPEVFSIALDGGTLADLEGQAEKYGASVSEFLLACWQVLLWRVLGQSEMVVGVACDGRSYEGLAEAIGLFAKYVPTQCSFEGGARFDEALAQIVGSTREAYEWQEYFSWAHIAGLSDKLRGQPFFPFSYSYEERLKKHAVANISFSIHKQRVYVDRFKVNLSCIRDQDALITEFHYDANILLAEDVERLAKQFHKLVESAVNNPAYPIGRLDILPDLERRQLLIEFNDTTADYPEGRCLHHLFERQVERTPDAVAVAFEDQYLSYWQLNASANRLARHLQAMGVGPGVLVAVYAARSPELIIGLLGVLKAGAAYVPLDHGLPKERLDFLLQDAQASVVLTQEIFVEELSGRQARVLCLDADWQAIALHSEEDAASEMSADNLAYVIYTSGSTGRPKGVMIPHRGLVNYVSWASKAYRMEGRQGAPVHSLIGFDLTITSLFVPLLSGQSAVLMPEDQGIEALSDTLRLEDDFSLLKLTPAHLEVLSQQLTPEQAAGRARAFIIGGEALSGETLSFWRTHAPETRLINEYGPTETVVGCCVYEVDAEEVISGPVPIGRPIANTQLYVLGEDLLAVPRWVPAELHIGGAGLARGYWGRPELTAERFIPNPFSDKPGERLYKTGDLVRHLLDKIEYLGRFDHQVKIRGFRIELGEIEAVLKQHPTVREAVMLAREDVPDDKRLVGYIVPERETGISLDDLRQFLEGKLPDYMIPSACVILNALPLTPNGKVDRKNLPAPDQSRPDLERPYVAPRTHIEEELAQILREILRVERVGIYDNFFDLGGHSLLLTQLSSRIRDSFQVDLALGVLFDNPTIVQMTATIAAAQAEQEDAAEVAEMLRELKQLTPEAAKQLLEFEDS